jgi:BirA family biotin operon repressor/biotin-[acetyl-CoA-carboxylase] ligase
LKEEILKILLEGSGYISGQELSRSLQVSRTAIWKAIKQLESEGYIFEASTNKGYRLVSSPDVMTEAEVGHYLNTRYMGRRIAYLESVGSTNDEIKREAAAGAEEGLVIIAEEQYSGRGRKGRSWATSKGESIAASILLRPELSPEHAFSITPVLALSIVQGLEKEAGIKAGIKWPNDIVLDNKKLCGILTEMNAEMDRINFIVVGMGININQPSFPRDISDIATSLRVHSGEAFSRKKIIAGILNCFEENYEIYKKDRLKPMIPLLKEYSVVIGKHIRLVSPDSVREGTAVDMDEQGGLIVRLDNGETIMVISGDVSVRGLYEIPQV